MKMKKLFQWTSSAMILIACYCALQTLKAQELSSNCRRDLFEAYVCALDSFAMVMPQIGHDTESFWAADTVHAMAMNILNNEYSSEENKARVYQMNNYIAYGMEYFAAVLGTAYAPEETEYVFHMIQTSDSLYSSIANDGFKDSSHLLIFGYLSYYHLRLYAHLQNEKCKALGLEPIFTENIDNSFDGLSVIRPLLDNGVYEGDDLEKIEAPLEAVTFFNTFCPLIQRFASDEEVFNKNRTRIIEIASYFDKYAPLCTRILSRCRTKNSYHLQRRPLVIKSRCYVC